MFNAIKDSLYAGTESLNLTLVFSLILKSEAAQNYYLFFTAFYSRFCYLLIRLGLDGQEFLAGLLTRLREGLYENCIDRPWLDGEHC